jgi:hypothetical protein
MYITVSRRIIVRWTWDEFDCVCAACAVSLMYSTSSDHFREKSYSLVPELCLIYSVTRLSQKAKQRHSQEQL